MTMPTSTFTEVQHKSNQAQTSSVTVTPASTPTAGNVLVAYATATTAIADPSGWTLVESITTGLFAKVWYKISAGTETSLTISATSATLVAAGLAEISGPTQVGVHGQATLGTGNWYAPGVTIAPNRGSVVLGIAFFKFKTTTLFPFSSGNKGLPTPGGWTSGLKPSRVAHPAGLQGNGRPFVRVGTSSTVASDAVSAHFGITTASWGGSQSVQFLHDWWVENQSGTTGATNTLGSVALELTGAINNTKVGSTAPSAYKVGSSNVDAMYVGSTKVYG